MLERYAFYFGALATILTLAWLFRPTERVTFTSGLSFVLWAFLALNTGDLTIVTNSGSTTAADLPDAARLILALLALLSMLAFILYRVGIYPPTSEETVGEGVPDAPDWRTR